MTFAVGSLVEARGREWVVLPDSTDDFLLVRPLAGHEAESTGILTSLEEVKPATFKLPDPNKPGDYKSARMLRDALQLGFRATAGPFRSLGHIDVTPRPYQLVPLLMALKQDVVRLLIADDVGIGKTIEAGLIARELLDTGDITRTAVLCPPHLAEQWQAELSSKFHIDAELVLASIAGRLERNLPADTTIFDVHPHVIVSTDFIKSDKRRDEFLRTCPHFVIVDEAHTCVEQSAGRGAHQRHRLVRGLADDSDRHLVLVTATPHSGKTDAFRSLIASWSASEREHLLHATAEQVLVERARDRRQELAPAVPDAAPVFPDIFANQLSYNPDLQTLIWVGEMTAEQEQALLNLSADPAYLQAVRGIVTQIRTTATDLGVLQLESQYAEQINDLRSQEQAFQSSLDSYKIQLGLPTDLPLT